MSLGTTGQWWVDKTIALQGTLLGGAGYTAVGTIDSTVDADYNYGLAPQALASLRLIFGREHVARHHGPRVFRQARRRRDAGRPRQHRPRSTRR